MLLGISTLLGISIDAVRPYFCVSLLASNPWTPREGAKMSNALRRARPWFLVGEMGEVGLSYSLDPDPAGSGIR